MKPFYFLAILVLANCSAPAKKETTESTPKSEQPSDNGVTIDQQSEPDTLKGSLKAYAEGNIGSTNLQINYYSPAVRGRMIWGGLVAFDNVWVTGAHKATNFSFDAPLIFGDQEIPAGKYGFFTIPGKEKWTIILNKNWNQHLADDYDVKDDVLRLEITPQTTDVNQERLMYSVELNSVVIRWEKLRIEIPVKAK